jgi:hypothetical protein
MQNFNFNEIKQNFTQAAQEFQLSDCFSLKPFANRYQATLILGAYTSAIFLSPIIVNLLLAPFNSLLMGVGLVAMIYGAYHLYQSKEQAVAQPAEIENAQQVVERNEQQQKDANADLALKAGSGAVGTSVIISLAQQVLPLLIGAVMAHRIIKSISDESWQNFENFTSKISIAK